MTDAELLLVEEIVARLRDGLPIHDIAPALDPSLVELATSLAGEMSEVGWVANQAVPSGFDAVWQGVAALGGVGASGAAAATIGAGGTAAGAGGSATSGGVMAGGAVAGGGASAGGFGGAITGIIGGIGGTTAAVAATAVVASAVVATVMLSDPGEQAPPDEPPVVAAPDLPGDETEPPAPTPVRPPDGAGEEAEEPDPPSEDVASDPPPEEGDEPEDTATTADSGTADESPASSEQAASAPEGSSSPSSTASTPPSGSGSSRPDRPDPDPAPREPEPAPPVARDVSVTVVSREPTPIDVLANDRGPDVPLDPSSLRVVSNPSNGSATVANNRITYRSARLWLGEDTFTYRICDRAGRCAQAQVTVTTVRRVEASSHQLPSPPPRYTFSLGSSRDPDSAEFVELGGGRVDRVGHDSWRWLGPPGRVDYPVTIVVHVANKDGSLSELRMTIDR